MAYCNANGFSSVPSAEVASPSGEQIKSLSNISSTSSLVVGWLDVVGVSLVVTFSEEVLTTTELSTHALKHKVSESKAMNAILFFLGYLP